MTASAAAVPFPDGSYLSEFSHWTSTARRRLHLLLLFPFPDGFVLIGILALGINDRRGYFKTNSPDACESYRTISDSQVKLRVGETHSKWNIPHAAEKREECWSRNSELSMANGHPFLKNVGVVVRR
ncbi:hypothetical protein CEXT_87691 [Caerostris extrusa]|uniref:Uncharacterized protein n=1 Tax=Caerostris extrusa TaxID=172846 RepID=A0AAV4Y1D3_CAEEX|nr:hypothetical protein CEXT_87691 [Caerostris extrusa]